MTANIHKVDREVDLGKSILKSWFWKISFKKSILQKVIVLKCLHEYDYACSDIDGLDFATTSFNFAILSISQSICDLLNSIIDSASSIC